MHPYLERILHDIGSLGSAAVFGILIVFLFFVNREVSVLLFLGGLIIFVITSIIRFAYFKGRPSPKKYANWIEKIDAASFPSTHTARAALAVSIVWNHVSLTLRLLSVALLLVICYSRIARKRHDLIDVAGGVILGILVGYATLQL